MRVTEYDEKYRESVIKLMMDLQDHERTLSADRPPSAEVSENQLDYLLTACTESVGRIYIAITDLRAVGIMVIFQDQEHEGTQHVYPKYRKFCLVSDLVVSKECRGKGIAGLLMNKAYEYTKSLGYSYVRLSVLSSNTLARSFYERSGFELYEVTYRIELP